MKAPHDRPSSSIALVGIGAWLLWIPIAPATLAAQAVTTAEIRGTVRGSNGAAADDATVRVTNRSTGVTVDARVRHGRFLVPGLEVGGPYVVVVRRLGFAPQQRDGLFLSLDPPLELHFVLLPPATEIDTVRVTGNADEGLARERTGAGSTISDSLLHRLPSMNRDMYDFVRLVPQVSTRVGLAGGGLTGGGVNTRFNNFLVDGTSDRNSNNSSLSFGGGKSIPIDAVKEYQVLLAPFDVRYGDFAGALVNAITKGGTNDAHGSVFGYLRDDRLFRPGVPYDREQYGFTVGGPIIRDRLHFFLAPEIQRLTAPSNGPYLGQPAAASPPLPVAASDVARFADILHAYGLAAGSGGVVQNSSPLRNLFARVDLALPAWNSRLTATDNYVRTFTDGFSRSARDTFYLESYQLTTAFASRISAVQLHTNLRGGGYNHLISVYKRGWSEWIPASRQPVVQVIVQGVRASGAILKTGTAEQGQGLSGDSWSAMVSDDLTLPVGAAHEVTVGAQVEPARLERRGLSGSYGTWTFSSLNAFNSGSPTRYDIKQDSGAASIPMGVTSYAAYAGDRWRVGERLSVTIGLRADGLLVSGHAPYNLDIDTTFVRRTDRMPARRPFWSPRVGFNWDVGNTRRDIVRGGVGVFTGRPPLSWEHSALYSYGTGSGNLHCGPGTGTPPDFVADYRAAPTACKDGQRASPGDVDLLDPNLRMAQSARASLAYERRLPWDLVATVEGLATRNISDFLFVNLNLKAPQPQDTDGHGRVMYGTVSPGSGTSSPSLRRKEYSEVIDLTNDSRNRSYDVSARLQKRFSRSSEVTASYTYSHARDTQLPIRVNLSGIVNWSSGRVVSGRHDDLSPTTSLYDLPHRVVVAATYAAPWRRWGTDFSMYYVGESGSPFTDIAKGIGSRGDLNADGAKNDPIYIPRSAMDSSEIQFSDVSDSTAADTSAGARAQRIARQQSALDKLIDATPCLRRQRGQIMARNSCRQPWSHTTIASVRQSLSSTPGHALSAQLDVYNVLNLLNARWGHQYQTGDNGLLEQVGESLGLGPNSHPIFRYDTTSPQWFTLATESAYQIQLSVRYSF